MKSIIVIIVSAAIAFVAADSVSESPNHRKRSFGEEFGSSGSGQSVGSSSVLSSDDNIPNVQSTVDVSDVAPDVADAAPVPAAYSASAPTSAGITAPVSLPTNTGPLVQLSKEVFVVNRHVQPISYPYPVPVQRNVAVPVPSPVPFPVDHPYAVRVASPYPVPVERPVPYAVDKPVPHPIAVPYPVPIVQNVLVPIAKPFPVPVVRRIPVPVATPIVIRPLQPDHGSVHGSSSYPTPIAVSNGYGIYDVSQGGYGSGGASSGYGSSSYRSYYRPALSSYSSSSLSSDSSSYSSLPSCGSSKCGDTNWTPIYKHNADHEY